MRGLQGHPAYAAGGLDAPMVEHVRALREAHPAAPVYVTGHSLGAAT